MQRLSSLVAQIGNKEVAMSKDHHADGQQDYEEGKYKPPHSITPLDHAVHNDRTLDKMQKDNDEYDAGYDNARKQK
jgi:hypothetical protein